MALVGTYKLPTKIIDGTVTTIDFQQWADGTLTTDELSVFTAEHNKFEAAWAAEVASGNVKVENIDASGNVVASFTEDPWPQSITFKRLDGSNEYTASFNIDYTSDDPTPSASERIGAWRGTNHTLGVEFDIDYGADGLPVSISNVAYLDVSRPEIVGSRVTWTAEPKQLESDAYRAFQARYRNDPSITWPSDSDGSITGSL